MDQLLVNVHHSSSAGLKIVTMYPDGTDKLTDKNWGVVIDSADNNILSDLNGTSH